MQHAASYYIAPALYTYPIKNDMCCVCAMKSGTSGIVCHHSRRLTLLQFNINTVGVQCISYFVMHRGTESDGCGSPCSGRAQNYCQLHLFQMEQDKQQTS